MRDALKSILSKKENKEGMHIQSIVDALILNFPEIQGELTREKLLEKVNKFLLKDSKDKKGDFAKAKKGIYRFVARKRARILPNPITENNTENENDTPVEDLPDTNFFGKAGEYAVMSELLFKGFNANNMAVDEGIDIIASKDNNFYFIQVKTVTLRMNRRASAKIKQKNFDRFINQQMRYVIAVRCDKEIRFFTLSNHDIQLLHHNKALSISEKTKDISIKIRYEEATGAPLFYDEKEMSATFWEGFERIEATPIV